MLTYPSPPTTPSPAEACSPENRLGNVLNDQYELISVLGVGAYGTVYKARNIHTHAEYAIKALNKLGLDQRQRTFQEREINLHHRASRHDNVVSLVQILESNDCTFVVLEYCPEGDLFAKITEEGHYTGDDFKAKCVFLQIIDAIRHCHSKGIFHRDLKPENILVKDNGWTMKLADFGLATQDRVSSDFGCGSTFYMSPECQTPDPQPYTCYASAPNDVWALGVILVNLTCGRNPWKRASMEDSTFRAYMHDRNFLQTILPISNQINYILQRIFEVDPSRRITLAELRELVVCCTSLTQGSSALPTQRPGQLATPPQSACGSPISFGDISPIDLLPAQQYPIANNYPITFNMPPTPPASNGNSPVLMPHDTQQKRQALRSRPTAVAAPTSWTRCGQVISQLNSLPRASCLWNNLPLY